MDAYQLLHPYARREAGKDVTVTEIAIPEKITVADMLDVPFQSRNKLALMEAVVKSVGKLGQFDLSKLNIQDANGYFECVQPMLTEELDAPAAFDPPDFKPVISVLASIDADPESEPIRYWALLFIKFGKPRDVVMGCDIRQFLPIMREAQKKMSLLPT